MKEHKGDNKPMIPVTSNLAPDRVGFELAMTKIDLDNAQRANRRLSDELNQVRTSSGQKDIKIQQLEEAVAERDQRITTMKAQTDPGLDKKVEQLKRLVREGMDILSQLEQISEDPYHPYATAASWAERYFMSHMRQVLGLGEDDIDIERAYRQDLLTKTQDALVDTESALDEAFERIEELEGERADFRDANRVLRKRIVDLDEQLEFWGQIFGVRQPGGEVTIGQRYIHSLRQKSSLNGHSKPHTPY